MRHATTVFDLPHDHDGKADPDLIDGDERHIHAITARLAEQVEETAAQLRTERHLPGRGGQGALERDQQIHRLTARLRLLHRYGADLCLGRMVPRADAQPVYIGRIGLSDAAGNVLLVDWRAPAAEPFFGATHADPMGLSSRRRYRWNSGRITDYWDEVFVAEDLAGHAALDDTSAFIASLGASRSDRMPDVLTTIQADQNAIIRASSRGPLVVDGGPGTGKSVVALHRSAYLLYSDPQVGERRGGVLFVAPHRPYLSYVADVLPDLGEDGVRTCTLRDLVPEQPVGTEEPEVAAWKSSVQMVGAIEKAVSFYEQPPTQSLVVQTSWADVSLQADDWAEAFDAPDPHTPHNEAQEQIWDALVQIITDKHDEDVPSDLLRRELARHEGLRASFTRAWPQLDATDLVADLWSVPAYLRLCAPWLEPDQVRRLQREQPQAWTEADLPLLDAARHRLGQAADTRRRRRQAAAEAEHRDRMDDVVADLIAADDDGESVMTMLGVADLRQALDGGTPSDEARDALAGPLAHIVVDEAQELTDAQWQMLLRRCPSRSFTIVGDRAQARAGFREPWTERLQRVGLGEARLAGLSINYRTPAEVMAEAEPVIRAVLPDANVPRSVRSNGLAVRHGGTQELESIIQDWTEAHPAGVGVVIGSPSFAGAGRVRSLRPELVKGLEFDLVILVHPERFGTGIQGAVDRYVAMTRTTQQLVILSDLRSDPSAANVRVDHSGALAHGLRDG